MRGAGDGAGGGNAIYGTTPQWLDLRTGDGGITDTNAFVSSVVDARVRHNQYVENAPAANGDWLSRLVTAGPKGSIWALRFSYAVGPDGGTLGWQIASVPEPDPARAGVSDAGTLLRELDVTYLSLGGTADTYAPAFLDSTFNGQVVLRFMGDDHDPLTAITPGGDAYTGYPTGDGGAGVYRLRMNVTGKNAASAGFKVRLTEAVWVRLDDDGFS